jgi:hypothetical protein
MIGFIHCATIGNWNDIINEQLDKIKSSSLYEKTNKIIIGKLGEDVLYINDPKIQINENLDLGLGEAFTLNILWNKCQTEDCKVWYIHTKGVSRSSIAVQHWRHAMEHFTILRHKDCIEALKDNDIVGILWEEQTRHFSGNFWWANSQYIKSLKNINEWSNDNFLNIPRRYRHELWIGSDPKVRSKSLFQHDTGEKWFYDKDILYETYVKLYL